MRWQMGMVAICVGLTSLVLGQISQAAEDPQAQANVDRVARLFVSRTCAATMKMEIIAKDWQRTIQLKLWSLGQADVLVHVLQPPEDAGTAVLKVGNNAWTYLPKSNRTFVMPVSMMTTSWMGSQFTLNDLVTQSRLGEDYAIATSFAGQRDGIAVFEYTLTPKPAAAVVWGKIVLEIRQSDLMPVWERYDDEDGKLVRELSFSDYKSMGGRLIPTRLIMRPSDQSVERTTITYENIVFDAPISEAMFSMANIAK